MDSDNTSGNGTPPALPTRRRTTRFKRYARLFVVILLVILAFGFYWIFLNKYGNGERTGILVKITHKGNVFKTDEGEMWLSCRQMTNPERFYFSVTSDSVAKALKDLQDECVQLTYVQYRASLPWRGDSRYIVTSVVPIKRAQ